MVLQKIIVGMMEVNCYLIGQEKSGAAAIIDPGDDFPEIKKAVDRLKLVPRFIINTHGHMDHIGADDKFNLPVYIHSLDVDCLTNPLKNLSAMLGFPHSLKAVTRLLKDGQVLELDGLSLEVIHTPGHSPGSICLKVGNIIFTGDTLFRGSVGRTDFPGASENELLRSIREKLLPFENETKILPGHGPESTIGEEKEQNPFL